MEPEGYFPCSQEPATCVGVQSQINPVYTPSCLSNIHLTWSFHLRLGLPSDLFPPGFPTKILYALLYHAF
jgi:hypothetical protein